ncbi:hypothetical protein NDU88_008921 [Pleurodeles waltl]|uniref:Uncharacterized protein n=1 Tax=Pleurodeles waltl TaxID=8319 RepID=A0AAV7RX47_PLEWA|nr:hypothetical protein NDU88_008921 [Pleurodeles waltl]
MNHMATRLDKQDEHFMAMEQHILDVKDKVQSKTHKVEDAKKAKTSIRAKFDNLEARSQGNNLRIMEILEMTNTEKLETKINLKGMMLRDDDVPVICLLEFTAGNKLRKLLLKPERPEQARPATPKDLPAHEIMTKKDFKMKMFTEE